MYPTSTAHHKFYFVPLQRLSRLQHQPNSLQQVFELLGGGEYFEQVTCNDACVTPTVHSSETKMPLEIRRPTSVSHAAPPNPIKTGGSSAKILVFSSFAFLSANSSSAITDSSTFGSSSAAGVKIRGSGVVDTDEDDCGAGAGGEESSRR